MGQVRSYAISANIEPTVGMAMLELLHKNNDMSVSTYIRKLIIKDLKEQGVLTDSILASMVA